MKIKRGYIYIADLNPRIGSEQGGTRPVLVIQNNVGNKHSPTTIVACITSKVYSKAVLPTHCLLPISIPLHEPSIVMLEQIRVIDKKRIKKRIAKVPNRTMKIIDKKIKICLGLRYKVKSTKSKFAHS